MRTTLICLTFFAAFAHAQQLPARDEVVKLDQAFVPGKAGTGKAIWVVVSGDFPNTCYEYDRAEVKSQDVYTHEISVHATVAQVPCLMRLVPFLEEINMGALAPGEHLLIFVNGDGSALKRELTVQ